MRFSDFCDHKFLLRPAKQFHEVIRKIKFFPVFLRTNTLFCRALGKHVKNLFQHSLPMLATLKL